MRIDSSVQTAYGVNEPTAKSSTTARAAAKNSKDDAVVLSGTMTVSDLQAKTFDGPDVRMEKVQALRAALLDGSYRVSPHAVAKAMFGELLAIEA